MHSLTTKEEIKACEDVEEKNLDFDDSYQYRATKNLEAPTVTLDKDFKNIDIEAKRPEEIVKIKDEN